MGIGKIFGKIKNAFCPKEKAKDVGEQAADIALQARADSADLNQAVSAQIKNLKNLEHDFRASRKKEKTLNERVKVSLEGGDEALAKKFAIQLAEAEEKTKSLHSSVDQLKSQMDGTVHRAQDFTEQAANAVNRARMIRDGDKVAKTEAKAIDTFGGPSASGLDDKLSSLEDDLQGRLLRNEATDELNGGSLREIEREVQAEAILSQARNHTDPSTDFVIAKL